MMENLTDREKQIIPLIDQGMTYEEIGKHVNLSRASVDKIASNLREKLGCRNTVQLVSFLHKNNLINKE